VLIADFNYTFFLNKPEVLKLVQKTKLSSAAEREAFKEFLESLESIDFNDRGLDK
jgi:hypothetical protein